MRADIALTRNKAVIDVAVEIDHALYCQCRQYGSCRAVKRNGVWCVSDSKNFDWRFSCSVILLNVERKNK